MPRGKHIILLVSVMLSTWEHKSSWPAAAPKPEVFPRCLWTIWHLWMIYIKWIMIFFVVLLDDKTFSFTLYCKIQTMNCWIAAFTVSIIRFTYQGPLEKWRESCENRNSCVLIWAAVFYLLVSIAALWYWHRSATCPDHLSSKSEHTLCYYMVILWWHFLFRDRVKMVADKLNLSLIKTTCQRVTAA